MRAYGYSGPRSGMECGHSAGMVVVIEHLVVHVTTERVRLSGGLDAACRRGRAVDVVPPVGRYCRGVNEANGAFAHDQRERCEKVCLLGRECLARPVDSRVRCLVEITAAALPRGVGGALDGNRTASRLVLDGGDHGLRIRAVADEITEKGEAIDALLPGMPDACV